MCVESQLHVKLSCPDCGDDGSAKCRPTRRILSTWGFLTSFITVITHSKSVHVVWGRPWSRKSGWPVSVSPSLLPSTDVVYCRRTSSRRRRWPLRPWPSEGPSGEGPAGPSGPTLRAAFGGIWRQQRCSKRCFRRP